MVFSALGVACAVVTLGFAFCRSDEATGVNSAPQGVSGKEIEKTGHSDDPLPPNALGRIGTLRFRPQSNNFDFSSDGKRVAATGAGGIYIWDVLTGKVIRQWKSNASLGQLKYSLDGTTLFANHYAPGERNGIVYVWDLKAGTQKEPVPHVFKGEFACIGVARDGKLVAGANGKTVYLFDRTSGRELRRFKANTDEVLGLSFSPTGKTLVLFGREPLSYFWNVAEGKEIRAVEGQGSMFSSDGKIFLTKTGSDTIGLWDTDRGKRLASFHSPAAGFALSPDCRSVAVSEHARADAGGKIRILDVASGKQLQSFSVDEGTPLQVQFSRDGRLLGATTGIFYIWDLITGKRLGPAAETPHYMGFVIDGRTLLTAGMSGRLRYWEAATGKELRPPNNQSIPLYYRNTLLSLSRDGKALATSKEHDQNIQIRDLATGRVTEQLPNPEEITHLAISPNGKLLVAKNSSSTHLWIWDLRTGRLLNSLAAPEVTSAVVWSPDNRTVASQDRVSRRVYLWDVVDCKKIRDWQADAGVKRLTFSPDGRSLATAADIEGGPDRIRVWDVATGKMLHEIPVRPGEPKGPKSVQALTYSPDGKMLVWGDAAGRINFWDMGAARLRHEFKAHEGFISVLLFSPDGTLLASGCGADRTALIWDVTAVLSRK
jgi:WD40 repeat protein